MTTEYRGHELWEDSHGDWWIITPDGDEDGPFDTELQAESEVDDRIAEEEE